MKVSGMGAVFFDRRFFRFIAVGALNALFGSAIMFGLYNLAGCSYWLSSAMNYLCASVLSFFLNKYWTFGAKDWSARMVIAFALLIIAAYIAAYSAAKPLVYALLPGSDVKLRENIALAAGMCLFTGLNYIGQRFVVFRTGARKPPANTTGKSMDH